MGRSAEQLPKPIGISLSVERSALSVQRYPFSLFFFFLLAAPLLAVDAPWHGYTVYAPKIERAVVVDAAQQPLRYNHDSSVAWYRDRWFCVWNANTTPAEGAPGQLNFLSTSRDGLIWSPPQPVFSDPSHSVNPIPCPKGTQWQPNLLVVGDRLWCIWSQNSKDAHNGCYFSTLDAPDGLWTNRLLTWNGQADPVIDGHPYRLFPSQNPLRLASGRVLAPVTMIGPLSTNAAAGTNSWYGREKRNSVLVTDDGVTWHVSPGAVLPGLEWRQWEPTVFEQPDGSVIMFARNNFIPAFERATIRPEETLVWSISRDAGMTWTPHAFVPIETVVSRMHVLRQPHSDRLLMTHNDWPAGRFGADRRNLALFVNRGSGIDFVAGIGLTGREPEVAYPQMDIQGDTLLITYSQGPCALRNIRAVRVSPLPDPKRLYLYPRSNLPPAPQCILTNGVLTLQGGASLACLAAPDIATDRVRIEADIKPDGHGVLFDNRASTNGFVWGIAGTAFVHLGDPARNLRSTLPVLSTRWNRLGVSINYPKGEVIFTLNGQTDRVTFKPGRRSLASRTATLFGPNFSTSALPPLEGEVRSLTLDGTNRLFDASSPDGLTRFDKVTETANARKTETSSISTVPAGPDGRAFLRLTGLASAGVELPANERAAGDRLEFAFTFRIECGVTGTLCTVGDACQPARVVVRDGTILLQVAGMSQPCGEVRPGTWQRISLTSKADLTRVSLDGAPGATIRHTPQANWLYLGEGYPSSSPSSDIDVTFDLASIRSRITESSR